MFSSLRSLISSNKRGKKGTCILHIGMAKTGTTAIQSTLSLLDEVGSFQYARLGAENHSHIMTVAFHEKPFESRNLVRSGLDENGLLKLRKEYRNKIIRFVENCEAESVIFSAESFTTARGMGKDGPRRIREFLDPYFNNFHVVGYVRSPASAAVSNAQESLKAGRKNIGPTVPNYRQKFQPWINAFSDQEISFRAWNRKNFPNGNVVGDFASVIGLDLEFTEPTVKNESLSLEAVALLYAERKFGEDPTGSIGATKSNQRLISHLKQIRGRKFVLGEKFLRPAIKARMESIHWIEDHLGEKIQDKGSRSASAINSPDDLLKIAEDAEPILYRHVDKNIEPLKGAKKSRAELFDYMRNSPGQD